MATTSKTGEIFTKPSSSIAVIPRTYSKEETEKIVALREYAETLRLPESDPYYPNETRWLSDPGCAERLMRAAKFKVEDAKKRISDTMAWRREYKPDLIPPEEVRIESETGKIILNGFDINGRPIITMHPGRENTKTSDRQLRHLIYVLERAVDLMPPGQDSIMIVVDYRSTTLRTSPPISQAAKVLTILQHHYAERLGRAIVMNLPFILSFFYKGISPFLDPVTRDKMRFNPDLKSLVPEEQLDADFGGSYHYQFDPVRYWDSLISACHIAPDGGRTVSILSSPPTFPDARITALESLRGPDTDHVLCVSVTDALDRSTPADHSGSESDGIIEPRTPANGSTRDETVTTAPDADEEQDNDSNAKGKTLEAAAGANAAVSVVVIQAVTA